MTTIFGVGGKCATCPPGEYNEKIQQGIYILQVKLFHSDAVSVQMSGILYYMEMSGGEYYYGKTDKEGLSIRVHTNKKEEVKIVIGRDAAKILRRKNLNIDPAK